MSSPKIPKQYQQPPAPPPPPPPPALAPTQLDSLVPQFEGATVGLRADKKKKQAGSGRSSLVIPSARAGVIQSGLQIGGL